MARIAQKTSQELRQGIEEAVTAIQWRSSKIERTCRSPACAETMAALDGEDELTYLQIMWNELKGERINPCRVELMNAQRSPNPSHDRRQKPV